MNERREMYKSYWAFEAGKWTEIDSVNRQVVPEIYDAFSKKVGSINQSVNQCDIPAINPYTDQSPLSMITRYLLEALQSTSSTGQLAYEYIFQSPSVLCTITQHHQQFISRTITATTTTTTTTTNTDETAKPLQRGTPSQSYRASLAMWDHTLLPSTRHKWTHPALTPARKAATRSTIADGLMAELTDVVGYIFFVDSCPSK